MKLTGWLIRVILVFLVCNPTQLLAATNTIAQMSNCFVSALSNFNPTTTPLPSYQFTRSPNVSDTWGWNNYFQASGYENFENDWVQCPNGYAMTGFHLVQWNNRVSYEILCCKIFR